MIFSIKKLDDSEKDICFKTISPKAIFALIGDAIVCNESLSIVRMGDGESKILDTTQGDFFTFFEDKYEGWNQRLGIEGMPLEMLKKNIIDAGNTCTYFAPSISGISKDEFALHHHFMVRTHYVDNFFVNDWTKEMITMLLEASKGVFIVHNDYQTIINNFKQNYQFSKPINFDGFAKISWEDNDAAIQAAANSDKQLILFSAGPGGKIIGPKIAETPNKIVLDIGNTLIPWSEKI